MIYDSDKHDLYFSNFREFMVENNILSGIYLTTFDNITSIIKTFIVKRKTKTIKVQYINNILNELKIYLSNVVKEFTNFQLIQNKQLNFANYVIYI